MTAPRKGPRAGSRAHFGLKQLHNYGGRALIRDWLIAVGWDATVGEFERLVAGPLQRYALVVKSGVDFVVTANGRDFLGVEPEAPATELAITPGTYVPPMRPLSAVNMPGMRVMRPGALDYKAIPSRMGDQLIPHGAKAAA
jgi:hypothetical protein